MIGPNIDIRFGYIKSITPICSILVGLFFVPAPKYDELQNKMYPWSIVK